MNDEGPPPPGSCPDESHDAPYATMYQCAICHDILYRPVVAPCMFGRDLDEF